MESEGPYSAAQIAIDACAKSGETTLDLSGWDLTSLPPEIGSLTSLRKLDLSLNELKSLPSEIGHLTALTYLDISLNELTSLPPELGNLTALTELEAFSNNFTSLPPEIGALTMLDSIDVSHNKLGSIPREIGRLIKLRWLDISNNELTSLPPEIVNLVDIEVLNLSNNKLMSLSHQIASLPKLYSLHFDGNPLPTAYFDALGLGIDDFCAFLSSLTEGTSRLFEAKILITGEGRVGKSWALAALRNADPYKTIGEENTTWGIDRGELIVPHPKEFGESILLNSWDFGGQEIYRVTHQFFFSQDAIYLLVWNPRTGAEQCRVREWLRTIALRTGSAPSQEDVPASPRARVIMVATHACDAGGAYNPDYGHDRLEPQLREMIVDQIEIDSETGHNIDMLREMIAYHAAELPDMGQPLNTRWAAARNAVLRLRNEARWIDFDRFSETCAAHDVSDPGELRALAWTYLHSLGRAVWYGDRSDEGNSRGDEAILGDTIVLDAEWLSRAFVQVLEDVPTRLSGGMLEHHRFPQIWTDHGRVGWIRYKPGEYEILKQVMRRFDVALPTRESRGQRSLVPQLVPVDPPALPWGEATSAPGPRTIRLSCQLDYEAVGLAPRMIAAAEPWHVYANDVGLYWEGGAFLQEPSFDNEALVRIVGKERPRIDMTVSGVQPGFFMQELFKLLESESVLAFWKGMTRSYSIGCPGTSRDGGFCPHFFPYDPVVRRIKEGKKTLFNCPQCDSDWTAEALISGFEALRVRSSKLDERYMLEDLYNREQMPAPRIFLLEALETRLLRPKSWDGLIGKRFRLTLLSEFSGKLVAEAEFKLAKKWVKWLGPVTRLASLALTGAAVPLGGDLADQFSESAALLDRLAELPLVDGVRAPTGRIGARRIDQDQLASFARFLAAIELDPREQGMDIARGPDGKWYWMSAEEKATYTPQAAA